MLLVEETGGPGENHRRNHCQTLSHNVVSSTPRPSGIRTHNVGISILENVGKVIYK
jgi:hypothetical protein